MTNGIEGLPPIPPGFVLKEQPQQQWWEAEGVPPPPPGFVPVPKKSSKQLIAEEIEKYKQQAAETEYPVWEGAKQVGSYLLGTVPYAEEAVAGGLSLLPGVEYGKTVEAIRAPGKEFEKEHWLAARGLDVASLLAGGVALKAIGGVAKAGQLAEAIPGISQYTRMVSGIKGASPLGRGLASATRGSLTAAPVAAVSGYGLGEGGIKNRLQSAGLSTLFGGTLGAGLNVAKETIPFIKGVYRSLSDTPETAAMRFAAGGLESAGFKEGGQVQTALRGVHPNGRLGDISEVVRQQTADIGKASGKTAGIIAEELGARQAGRLERIQSGMESGFGKKAVDYNKSLAELESMRRTSEPLYRKAFSEGAQVNPQPVLSSIDTLAAKAKGETRLTLNAIKKEFLTPDGTLDTSVEGLHNTKMVLDGIIDKKRIATEAGERGIDSTTLYKLRNVRNQLSEELSKASPTYKQANEVYGKYKGLEKAQVAGREFMANTADEMADTIAGLETKEQRDIYRQGVVSRLTEMINSASERKDLTKIFDKNKLEKLRPTFETEAEYNKFIRLIENERNFAQTELDALAGSKTAQLQEIKSEREIAFNPFATITQVSKPTSLGGKLFGAEQKNIELAKLLSKPTEQLIPLLESRKGKLAKLLEQSVKERAAVNKPLSAGASLLGGVGGAETAKWMLDQQAEPLRLTVRPKKKR